MADPLSISASIAGLVTLADIAFFRTYRYVRAVKNASKEISALSSELGALYGVLCSVRSISAQLEGEAVESAPRLRCIKSCQKTLEEVRGILDRDKTSSLQDEPWETMRRKLRWPFKSSEVKSLINDIERHKQALGLALQVDGIAGLIQVLRGQEDLHSSLKEIENQLCLRLEIETRVMLNESRENILRTFGKIDPRRSHEMSRKLRHPGTGIWLTERPKFQHWLHSANGCLWLYGIPGAGKTVLASLVIDEVLPRSTPNHAVAYFYCDYKDQTTREPHGILGSLAQQLSKQDEQSFGKLQGFYADHGQGRKEPIAYDPTLLRNLINDMITNYDSTTIIIDALDECVGNTRDVTELLTTLGETTGDANVKLLFLSRDEIEIRELLDTSPQISIAAENSDLRLYVGYEIEERIRKNKLKIKNPSLKEQIVERLITGAEGMFRWVTCQIDRLCELPSDAARRKALQDLPRGLNLSYERILSRISQKDAEVRRLARRTLNWLFFKRQWPLATRELCQAVAINFGDVRIDFEAIPDESDILQHCSSLVRKSADGLSIEFAHFTVKEFLLQLDTIKDSEYAAFVMSADEINNELAKVCLTYINMHDFDQYKEINETHSLWDEKHQFREYANSQWPHHVQDWHDAGLNELLRKLLHPAKPSTLVSWAQEVLFEYYNSDHSMAIAMIGAGVKEATALHYAAMLCIPSICEWLIENGCDVNRSSAFGTPLQCAVITLSGFRLSRFWEDGVTDLDSVCSNTANQLPIIDVLLRARSDPNKIFYTGSEQLSTLSLALATSEPRTLAVTLLENGSNFNEKELQAILELCETESDYQQVEHCFRLLVQRPSMNDTKDTTQQMILKRALAKMAGNKATDLRTQQPCTSLVEEPVVMEGAEFETSMRTAAEFGQLERMVELLDRYHIPVNTACEGTNETALHLAAANDHLEITKALIDRGASMAVADNVGRTALHHSIRRSGCVCLQFLLELDPNVNVFDTHGMTPWHMTIEKDNIEALKLLIERGKYRVSPAPESVTLERSPLSYAAKKASVDSMSLLLSAGCGVHDVATGGLTPLHHAAKACSLESIQFLVENGSDVSPLTEDGSSPLHFAVAVKNAKKDEVVAFLILRGSDPFQARHDGLTPIDVLIEEGNGELSLEITERILQTFIDWKLPDRSVKIDLSQQLLRLCQLALVSQSLWLSTALKILLNNGADLLKMNEAGKTAFGILLCSWQQQFSRLSYEELFDDEEWSPIEAACSWTCSDELFKRLLDRSKALSDQTHATKLFASVSGAKRMDLADFLLEAGLDPNSRSILGETPLMQSAESGHAQMVAWLIQHGGDLKAVDHDGWNAAYHACRSGSLEVIRLLKTTDIDWHGIVSARFDRDLSNDVSLLHLAAAYANSTFLEYLIDGDLAQDLNCITSDGLTPLHVAIWAERLENVAFLLSRNVVTSIMSLGESPLHMVVRHGERKMYSLFRSHKCDLEMLDGNGWDCEMIALKNCHRELAGEIASVRVQGHNHSALSERGYSKVSLQMLKLAIEHGDLELCKRALDIGVNLEAYLPNRNVHTPISYCVEMERPEIAKFLVMKGASNIGITHKSYHGQGYTLFHYAAECNIPGLLETLLEKHSSQLLQNVAPVHPIHMAVLCSATECIELMLHHKYTGFPNELPSVLCSHEHAQSAEFQPRCDAPAPLAKTAAMYLANVPMGERQDNGWDTYHVDRFSQKSLYSITPLHLAAGKGDYDCVQSLLAEGSMVNAVDSTYWTALHFAAKRGDDAMSELLLASGAQTFRQTNEGRTPPMVAAIANQFGVLRTLLKNGIDLEVRDHAQQTILHLAARSTGTEALVHIMTTTEDYDLESECASGHTVLTRAFESSRHGIGSLMNLGPSPRAYTPQRSNVLTAAIGNDFMSVWHIKMLLKRIPSELFTLILNHRAYAGGTPLYAACTQTDPRRQNGIINLLLDAGAQIDQDGGPYGTSLMAACTTGRLSAVKLLISRGAQTTFVKDGQTTSVLDAARRYPGIIRWLLVGRFTEGPRRLT